ncbi:MAG: CoA-binding protein [Nitrospirae bacterium]|nr:CoA-binding protein [Nitrospirota bacterium]
MDEKIKDLLNYRSIAVVGLSPKEDRPSYMVARYLQSYGYKITPVNPKANEILGERCYPNLSAIPYPIDVVDIFRRPEDIPPIVDEAIKIKAKVIWMQEGIINEAAAEKAKQAGIEVVMDKCMLKEHKRVIGSGL